MATIWWLGAFADDEILQLGNEITAHKADWREQYDLSTPHALPTDQDPLYHNLLAPNQWPSEKLMPHFRAVFEDYMKRMGEISIFFTSLIAESIELPANAFDSFFDQDQQHKLKIVKYPDSGTGVGQGVGPHKDSMLTSYLLQASDHKGLQAQNTQGEWIDCMPAYQTLYVYSRKANNIRSAQEGNTCSRSRARLRSSNRRRLRKYYSQSTESSSWIRCTLQYSFLPRSVLRRSIRVHARA